MTETIRHFEFVLIVLWQVQCQHEKEKTEILCLGHVQESLCFSWGSGDLSWEKEDTGIGEAIF
jgi:hypothetical protein